MQAPGHPVASPVLDEQHPHPHTDAHDRHQQGPSVNPLSSAKPSATPYLKALKRFLCLCIHETTSVFARLFCFFITLTCILVVVYTVQIYSAVTTSTLSNVGPFSGEALSADLRVLINDFHTISEELYRNAQKISDVLLLTSMPAAAGSATASREQLELKQTTIFGLLEYGDRLRFEKRALGRTLSSLFCDIRRLPTSWNGRPCSTMTSRGVYASVDSHLLRALKRLLRGKTILDVGAGTATFGERVVTPSVEGADGAESASTASFADGNDARAGVGADIDDDLTVGEYTAIDAHPSIEQLTHGRVRFIDLSDDQEDLSRSKYDWVVVLRAHDGLNCENAPTFVSNLLHAARKGVILAWATPQQTYGCCGRVQERKKRTRSAAILPSNDNDISGTADLWQDRRRSRMRKPLARGLSSSPSSSSSPSQGITEIEMDGDDDEDGEVAASDRADEDATFIRDQVQAFLGTKAAIVAASQAAAEAAISARNGGRGASTATVAAGIAAGAGVAARVVSAVPLSSEFMTDAPSPFSALSHSHTPPFRLPMLSRTPGVDTDSGGGGAVNTKMVENMVDPVLFPRYCCCLPHRTVESLVYKHNELLDQEVAKGSETTTTGGHVSYRDIARAYTSFLRLFPVVPVAFAAVKQRGSLSSSVSVFSSSASSSSSSSPEAAPRSARPQGRWLRDVALEAALRAASISEYFKANLFVFTKRRG